MTMTLEEAIAQVVVGKDPLSPDKVYRCTRTILTPDEDKLACLAGALPKEKVDHVQREIALAWLRHAAEVGGPDLMLERLENPKRFLERVETILKDHKPAKV